jgi:anti-sigma factor RsiW
MSCRFTRPRLVAWLDGELAPAERSRLEEHLDVCPRCAARAHALAETTPEAPTVHVDPHVRHRMHLAVAEALDRTAPPPTAPSPLLDPGGLLTGSVSLPRGLVLLYAAALLVAVGVAAGRGLPSAETVRAPTPVTALDPRTAASEAHRPAAYTPEDHWF